jgi:hypothetical protein
MTMPSGQEPVVVATAYAARNGATLTACECEANAFEVTVEVEVVVDGFLLAPGARTIRAVARAVVALPSPSPSGAPGPAG